MEVQKRYLASANGTDWQLVTPQAPWAPRRWHSVFVFQGQLWLLGGADALRSDGTRGERFADVCNSPDGLRWTHVLERAPWPAGGQMALVHDGRIWLVGGEHRTDVWASRDGRQWERVTLLAPWPLRMAQGVAAFDGKMWVFGGVSPTGPLNDVWFSTDGAHWQRTAEDTPWGPHSALHNVVFQKKLWIFGGKEGGRIGFYDDVWYLSAQQPSARAARPGGGPNAPISGFW